MIPNICNFSYIDKRLEILEVSSKEVESSDDSFSSVEPLMNP